MTHVVQIEKSLQKASKCSDLLALFLKQTSAEVTGFDAKKMGCLQWTSSIMCSNFSSLFIAFILQLFPDLFYNLKSMKKGAPWAF